jgi:hypothetical protein
MEAKRRLTFNGLHGLISQEKNSSKLDCVDEFVCNFPVSNLINIRPGFSKTYICGVKLKSRAFGSFSARSLRKESKLSSVSIDAVSFVPGPMSSCGCNSGRHVTQPAVSGSNVCCTLFLFLKIDSAGWKCNLLFQLTVTCIRELEN